MLSGVRADESGMAGSDAGALSTSARREGDDYVLNGSKQFITTGKNADVALVFARTDPAAGTRGISGVSSSRPPRRAIGCRRVESKLGQRASDTCQIVLEDVRVSAPNRAGRRGRGLPDRTLQPAGRAHRHPPRSRWASSAAPACEVALVYARRARGLRQADHRAPGCWLPAGRDAHPGRDRQADRPARRCPVDAGRPCLMEACMAKLVASERRPNGSARRRSRRSEATDT